MDRDGFYADFGLSTVERNAPMFLLKKSCCWWSGQSWPYATSQTLKAMANVTQRDQNSTPDSVPARNHYVKLQQIYARYHRSAGLQVLVDGKSVAKSPTLDKLILRLESNSAGIESLQELVGTNFVVNNDGDYYLRSTATYVSPSTSVSKLNDGNYCYTAHPPNR
jgi:hypothetical protein